MGKPWKELERAVAKAVGGQRTPLSGSGSRHTSGDVIHKRLYVEVKYRQRHALVQLFQEVQEEAAREGKIPLVVLRERRSSLLLMVMDMASAEAVLKEVRAKP